MQVVNTLLDRGFIGHLPASSVAAQGASMSLIFLMFSFAMSSATAATALVSRAFGAGDDVEVRLASRKCFGFAWAGGLLLCLLTLALSAPTATLLLPSGEVEAKGLMTLYQGAFGLALPAIFVIQGLAGSLRAVGDTKSPMVISGLQIALHIGLNFICIFPPHHLPGGLTLPGLGLGLPGAGLALAMSSTLAAAAYAVYVARTPLGSMLKAGLPGMDWARRIFRIAAPAAGGALVRVGSITAFMVVLKFVPEGAIAIAATGVAFGLEGILFMPAFGLGSAAAALVGQSLGMEQPKRAERLGWTAAHHGALVTVLSSAILFWFAPQLVSFMLEGKADIVAQASYLVRAMCVTEVFFSYFIILVVAMQGAGDTVRPMWLSVVGLWIVRLPLTYVLAIASGFGATGAWLAIAISQAVQGLLAIGMFKRGLWKTVEV